FPEGYFIKPTLGECSGDDAEPNQAEIVLSRLEAGLLLLPGRHAVLDELFLAQRKIAIRREYRVHSVEASVVADLTCDRYKEETDSRYIEPFNGYVQSVLDRLPASLVSQTLIAWDIAQTGDGEFFIIEANLTGFH